MEVSQMANRKTGERARIHRRVNDDALNAPWRNTPLDNWSKDVDPFIMSGDQYVDNEHDLGTTRRENLELLNGQRNPLIAPFMHPTHDVSMRNGEDDL
jgi:hypothetical protein